MQDFVSSMRKSAVHAWKDAKVCKHHISLLCLFQSTGMFRLCMRKLTLKYLNLFRQQEHKQMVRVTLKIIYAFCMYLLMYFLIHCRQAKVRWHYKSGSGDTGRDHLLRWSLWSFPSKEEVHISTHPLSDSNRWLSVGSFLFIISRQPQRNMEKG